MMNTAGIDVSYKTVTLVINQAGHTGKPLEFKNTPQGHLALVNRVRKAQVNRVYFEANGLYYLNLALALDDAGLAFMVINPKAPNASPWPCRPGPKPMPSMPHSWPNLPAVCPSSPGHVHRHRH